MPVAAHGGRELHAALPAAFLVWDHRPGSVPVHQQHYAAQPSHRNAQVRFAIRNLLSNLGEELVSALPTLCLSVLCSFI